ncbi:hypothetical protein N7475_000298 [Penicillium sp. IBT 31633x]|nr:hypothetical protein N7475_000298 [Penicillium sp. IBT 31633x]
MHLQSSEGFPQSAEQSEEGAVWEVVKDDSDTDDEDLGVVKAEDALVEDIVSVAIHRLPCLIARVQTIEDHWASRTLTTSSRNAILGLL